MAANNLSTDSSPNHLARMAIDQLLNRQEDDHSPAAADRRAARRLCGRWLAHRRMLRGMTRAEVAQRVKLDEDTLGLLELGLTDAPLTAGEVWLRLALVLEGDAHDFEQVEMVLSVALGQSPIPDADWLEVLEAELEEVEAANTAPETVPTTKLNSLTPTDLPADTLNKADELLHEHAILPAHSVHVLSALHRAGSEAASIPALRKSIVKYEHLRLNVIDLQRVLERLARLDFVKYTSGDPSVYQITPRGREAFIAALRKADAERRRIDAEKRRDEAERDGARAATEFSRVISRLPNAEGRL
jgi:DNA-binding PadR family transcriptional regulator